MKVLVIGSGGREHALVWKLLQSDKVDKVYAAPGNGGTDGFPVNGKTCENLALPGDPAGIQAQEALVRFARQEGAGLTVIGPEAPLAAGLADRFREAGLTVLGPGARAALLESSKAYAKAFMEKYGVRTARSWTFTGPREARNAVREHFARHTGKLVIKADGLAAGKGVVIASDPREAEDTVSAFMEGGALDGAGATLVIEEFLEGNEVSILSAVSVGNGTGVIRPFIPARDHKRRFDGGQGPNTGGMGAIAPVPDFSAGAYTDFEQSILIPTLNGIRAEGMEYRGFLFFGLMVREETCYLLEYNARLGDPETQAVMPLMDFDFAELCLAAAGTSLDSFKLAWKGGAVCAPVAVASGYPGPYRTGGRITLDQDAFAETGAVLFVSGAVRDGAGLRTSGGRVFSAAAYGENPADARDKAYRALGAVGFDGMEYRRDIGGH